MNHTVSVGIDLGATNCCIAVVQNGKVEVIENDLSCRFTPNYVAFTETECLTGAIAQTQAIMNLCDTIFDIKQIIGRLIDDEIIQRNKIFWPFEIKEIEGKLNVKARYKLKDKLFAPEELYAMVLVKLKETAQGYLGQEVKDVVIGVPAYFNDLQRVATLNAGTIAGLNVLKLINEPTAAALTFALTKEIKREKTILIFDFGSSKLDVSIVNIRSSSFMDVIVRATAGDHLGGTDINRLMVTYLMDLFNTKNMKDMSNSMRAIRRLVTAWEKAKIVLSSNKETSINVDSLFDGVDFVATITRATFEEVCNHLWASIGLTVQKALDEARLDKSEIDEVVLVGGSTRIPKVQQLLTDFFEGKKLNKSLNADEAVAYGAALQASKLLLTNNETNLRIIDIIPYDIKYYVESTPAILLYKNGSSDSQYVLQNIPTSPNTQTLYIKLFQSSSFNRVELGSVALAGSPFKLAWLVKFQIDGSGVLKVYVFNPETNEYDPCKTRNDRCILSKNKLERLLCDEKRCQINKKDSEDKEAGNDLEMYIHGKGQTQAGQAGTDKKQLTKINIKFLINFLAIFCVFLISYVFIAL